MELLLIRHGEIPSNKRKIYAGRSSEGLTDRGIDQAREVARKLTQYKVNAIYSSPVYRAVQTSQIIGTQLGQDFQTDEAFREIEMGPWEGRAEEDIELNYPDQWELWNSRPAELNMPGRETLDVLLRRILKGVHRIEAFHKGRTVVIVTHVAIIRVLLLWRNRMSLNLYKSISVPNAEIFRIEITN
jgi:broad specificity phosphatase PhoE